MAISGQQVIQVGLQNESTGSDSLYDAFNKVKTNFTNLFENASQYTTFVAGNGISLTDVPSTGTLTINNAGVTSIVAGTNITINQANGAVTISSNGGGNGGGGTVTSVGITPVSASRIAVTNSPVTSAGNMTVDLATSGVSAGTYTYPTLTVDAYGRVTNASSAAAAGTVTSVGVVPGDGIQVTGSPVTTSGNINITNTGVTRLNAGTGISLSGGNGNVTVSTTITGGTVTGVTVASTTLTVSGSPITTTGTITINLPTTITLTGNITGGNLTTGGRVVATGNVTGGNLTTAGLISATGNVTGGNLTTAGLISATGNITGSNIRATGSLLSNSISGVGYATGAGGTVTQGTSRTTGVTINKTTGAITLFTAAGTSAYTTFTVTNSTVAATDVIIVNQKSGTDMYDSFVTNVAAGSFALTFSDLSGTTSEAPVFNFAVIKAVAA
jgi:hypothetical protein